MNILNTKTQDKSNKKKNKLNFELIFADKLFIMLLTKNYSKIYIDLT